LAIVPVGRELPVAGVQRTAITGCLSVDVTTLELLATEPRPLSATGITPAAAYDERFGAVRDRLVRICTGLVGADVAEDVVHDAYLRGRDRFAQLRDADLFDGWITRLAVNLCINRHRAGSRFRALLPRLVASTRHTSAEASDIGLTELIERLSPRERTMIVLHYGHGYRLGEIARMTGLSEVNARSIIFRARRRLGEQLGAANR
jgi:RNA polymerase sigma-70 factor, ECF subfamily